MFGIRIGRVGVGRRRRAAAGGAASSATAGSWLPDTYTPCARLDGSPVLPLPSGLVLRGQPLVVFALPRLRVGLGGRGQPLVVFPPPSGLGVRGQPLVVLALLLVVVARSSGVGVDIGLLRGGRLSCSG
jgi:hypothetical protein